MILESTSPVGSTEQMAAWLAEMRPDLSFPQQVGEAADVNIAYCPERVLPGQVMVELIKTTASSAVCRRFAPPAPASCIKFFSKANAWSPTPAPLRCVS